MNIKDVYRKKKRVNNLMKDGDEPFIGQHIRDPDPQEPDIPRFIPDFNQKISKLESDDHEKYIFNKGFRDGAVTIRYYPSYTDANNYTFVYVLIYKNTYLEYLKRVVVAGNPTDYRLTPIYFDIVRILGNPAGSWSFPSTVLPEDFWAAYPNLTIIHSSIETPADDTTFTYDTYYRKFLEVNNVDYYDRSMISPVAVDDLIGSEEFANIPGLKAVQFENLFLNIPINSNVHFQSTTILHQEFYQYRTSFVILDVHVYNYREYSIPLVPYYAIIYETYGYTQYLPERDSDRKPLPREIPSNILEQILTRLKTNQFYLGLNNVEPTNGMMIYSRMDKSSALYAFMNANKNLGQFLADSTIDAAQATGNALIGTLSEESGINKFKINTGGIPAWLPMVGPISTQEQFEYNKYIRKSNTQYALLFEERAHYYVWPFRSIGYAIAQLKSPKNSGKKFKQWNTRGDFYIPSNTTIYNDKLANYL